METVLRLTLPPLVVLLVGWAQHRLGARLSGRLVGLPLTSGPFLLALLHTQGSDAAAHAAGGVVAGQLVVVATATGYARAATGRTPGSALGYTLPAAVGIGLLAGQLTSPAAALGITVAVVLVVLMRWRPPPSDLTAGAAVCAPAPGALAGRAVVTGGLVASLTVAAPLLGAHLAGLLAAVPLVIGVMAHTTHARNGVVGVRSMLRGTVAVVPGSGAFAAVLATALGVVPAAAAFAIAVSALVIVNACVARLDVAAERKR